MMLTFKLDTMCYFSIVIAIFVDFGFCKSSVMDVSRAHVDRTAHVHLSSSGLKRSCWSCVGAASLEFNLYCG